MTRRGVRWVWRFLAALLGLPLLAIGLLLAVANTPAGCAYIEGMTSRLTAGELALAGLAGRFPDALRIGHIELRDPDGRWLVIDKLALDWSPGRLLMGKVQIERLEAETIAIERLPPASPEEEPSEGPSLPVEVTVRTLRVGRLDLAQPVAGKPVALSIAGDLQLASLTRGGLALALHRLDGEGSYRLQGLLAGDRVLARLSAREPERGLIAALAGIEEADAIFLEAELEGPLAAIQTRLALDLGPLKATVAGVLDCEHDTIADLSMTAKAPAMQPRPDLSWQGIMLDAQVSGPFTKPSARGQLRIDGMRAAAVAVRGAGMIIEGDAGQVQLRAEIEGITLPGPKPDLLQAAPLKLEMSARLDAADRPVAFSLNHPLLSAAGKATTAVDPQGEIVLTLPDLQPFGATGGLDVRGHGQLILRMAQQGDTSRLDADGSVAITGGDSPVAKLLGTAAKLGISLTRRGEDIALDRLRLDGKTLTLSADGRLASQVADFGWNISLADLAAVMPDGSGRLFAQGRLSGPLDKLAVTAEVNGELATKDLPRGPIGAQLKLEGLPDSPSGQLTARGMLGGSPLELALAVQVPADGALQLAIDRADWKSARVRGNLALPKGSGLPIGKLDLRMTNLDDLRPLLGQPLTGTVSVALDTAEQNGRPTARLQVEARNAGLVGTATVEQSTLAAIIADPAGHPVLDGRLMLDGVSAGTLAGGSARMDLAGPLEALRLRLSTAIPNLAGADFRLEGAAILDARTRQTEVSELEASWKSETLRLLAPVRIAFADGVTLNRLRLGLRQAVLEATGRVSPTLDLAASLSDVSADLITPFAPDIAMSGMLEANARLTGTPARAVGRIEARAEGLQMQTGPGRALPAAKLNASVDLAGTVAHLDTQLSAGPGATLGVTGEAPLQSSGPFDLRAAGALDLKLLDPLLSAAGRRLRGQLTLNAALAGTPAEPRATGSLQLNGGELQDYAVGVLINNITGLIQGEGGTIRVVRLEGRAGPGKISASGTMDLLAEGMPVNLAVTARHARPLASDRLTVELNSDLAIRGQATGQLAASGNIHIHRAEIRIPERMPTSIAVLNVSKPGAPPPAAPQPNQDIALDLTLDAPSAIFVRGRGLDAELGGKVRVRGSAASPQPSGGFELRRGQFSVAGQTLIFNKGEVGFDGGSLTDPSLNFVANTTSSNMTATLTVSGSASNPRITLSSVPNLPQDEILAQLLFSRSANTLSPFEMVQMASALASFTGVTSGVENPLDTVRKNLGLDRLTVGGASPTLEAGRYVAAGVYLGAKQGISGAGTQATMQIDIAKGLKLESTVGTAAASTATPGSHSVTNSVGVIYQIEY